MEWREFFVTLVVLFSMLVLFSRFGYSQDACQPQDRMEEMEERLFGRLENLRRNSTSLEEELQALRESLQLSETTLNSLNSSLESTLNLFEQCAEDLSNTRLLLKEERKKNAIKGAALSVLITVFVLVRVVLIALKFKGFKINEVVSILT